ncbi:uncharacterized protein LOC143152307 [Ptiloglossa arizonensis]|uniref:uncharacterized protein LOC143152307 n=1 Tax=Ptiloglossa arizonensis TaxID=3350558 RepID=UPI003FA0CF47
MGHCVPRHGKNNTVKTGSQWSLDDRPSTPPRYPSGPNPVTNDPAVQNSREKKGEILFPGARDSVSRKCKTGEDLSPKRRDATRGGPTEIQQQSIIEIGYTSQEDSGPSPMEEEQQLRETEDKLATWGTLEDASRRLRSSFVSGSLRSRGDCALDRAPSLKFLRDELRGVSKSLASIKSVKKSARVEDASRRLGGSFVSGCLRSRRDRARDRASSVKLLPPKYPSTIAATLSSIVEDRYPIRDPTELFTIWLATVRGDREANSNWDARIKGSHGGTSIGAGTLAGDWRDENDRGGNALRRRAFQNDWFGRRSGKVVDATPGHTGANHLKVPRGQWGKSPCRLFHPANRPRKRPHTPVRAAAAYASILASFQRVTVELDQCALDPPRSLPPLPPYVFRFLSARHRCVNIARVLCKPFRSVRRRFAARRPSITVTPRPESEVPRATIELCGISVFFHREPSSGRLIEVLGPNENNPVDASRPAVLCRNVECKARRTMETEGKVGNGDDEFRALIQREAFTTIKRRIELRAPLITNQSKIGSNLPPDTCFFCLAARSMDYFVASFDSM